GDITPHRRIPWRGARRGAGDLRAGPRGRGAGVAGALWSERAVSPAGRGADCTSRQAGGADREARAALEAQLAQLLSAAELRSAEYAAATRQGFLWALAGGAARQPAQVTFAFPRDLSEKPRATVDERLVSHPAARVAVDHWNLSHIIALLGL